MGHIYVKGGLVPKEIYTGPPTGKGKGKAFYKQQGKRSFFALTSGNASHIKRGKFCPGGNNYQQGNKQKVGAKPTANQKRTTQQSVPNTAKNPKFKKGGKTR